MYTNGILALHPNKKFNAAQLKRSFLLQEETYVTNVEYFIAFHKYDGDSKQAEELEMLLASNIVIDANEKFGIQDFLSLEPVDTEFKLVKDAFEDAKSNLFKSLGHIAHPNQEVMVCVVGNGNSEHINNTQRLLASVENLRENYIARVLSNISSKTFQPISQPRLNTGVVPTIDALRLEILNYPVVNADISWHRLWEFKQDEDTKLHVKRFNRLIAELFNTRKNLREIQDEIQYRLEEYTKHVQLADLRYKSSKRVFIFKSAEALIEGVSATPITLLGPISDTLNNILNIDKDRVEYLQAKNSAPDREVSLLYELNNI
jgi:hypothetical protein